MLEIEMKFKVEDFAALENALDARQAAKKATRIDVDRYFNAPDRDFGVTDEALRIRSIGDSNCITYKGPKIDAQTKTRKEIEVAVAAGPESARQFAELLQHLGFRFTAEVRKQRTRYSLPAADFTLEVCLDDVYGLGCFAELEIVAPEDRFASAKAVLLKSAQELQLNDSERRSYLEMILELHQSVPTGESKP